MKRKNKFLAFLLAASLSFSVAACGSADSGNTDAGKPATEDNSADGGEEVDFYAAAQENMKNVSSLNGKMSIDMEMNISADGQTQSMKTSNTMDMSCTYNPLKIKMNMSVDAGEAGTTEMSIYADTAEDGTCTMYYNDGTSWQSQTVEASALEQYDAASNMNNYMQDIYHFQEAGTEQVDGKDARKYEGTITGDGLQEAVMSTGALDSLSSLGLDESQMESLFKDLDDLPITMWIDEAECYPVKYEMDMAPLMNTLMANMVEIMGEEAAGASIEFSTLHAVMTCSDYNAVEDFSIPDEAKAAAPAA